MPYHVCFVVKNLSEVISEYVTKGFLLFKDVSDAKAISENARVAFLIHASIGIIELLQL